MPTIVSHPSATRWNQRYGPWAVVTGASDGIGREIARALAERGARLVLVARRREALLALQRELLDRHGAESLVLPLDLGDPRAAAELDAATRHLDVGLLVAAAGFGSSGAFLEASLDTELDMIALNCAAVTAQAHAFGRRFAARGRGGMILFSSLVAFQGVPHAATYSATKAFVQSLAEALRVELGPRGVDVLASAPGPVRSGFERRADMQMGLSLPASRVARPTLDALGRVGTVRPGWLSKLLELSLSFLPRWGRVRVMSVVMGGMTKHQRERSATSREWAPAKGVSRLEERT